MSSYLSLFLSAFIAATLLSVPSEAVLYSLLQDNSNYFLLWLAATTGNTLGACVNYLLGRYFLHFSDRRWFPIKTEQLGKYQSWFQRYGVWSLLLSWLPVIGDGFTLIAGTMKTNFLLFVTLVSIGKGSRYAIVIYLFSAG